MSQHRRAKSVKVTYEWGRRTFVLIISTLFRTQSKIHNDIVPNFNGFTFQSNLVGRSKHFPIHSILFHTNKCTSLASYHLSLYVIN